jgi:hypothetical protein
MNWNMFTWYLKECLLEAKQAPTYGGDLPKKTTEDKTKPLIFQRVGLESGQPRVIGLRYFIMPSRMGKCQS